MANSKANIYPIQLQGAQLNLNKYDAEIKQYSGFNKNNAPYVGGCLANVFTKDETQEGSTSENTYIDTNGDVYHVDTSGLWKNDEKVLDTQGSSFYEVEEVDFEKENIIKIFSEHFYIYSTERDSTHINLYARFYDFYHNIWVDKFINYFLKTAELKISLNAHCFSSGPCYYGITYYIVPTNISYPSTYSFSEKTYVFAVGYNLDEVVNLNFSKSNVKFEDDFEEPFLSFDGGYYQGHSYIYVSVYHNTHGVEFCSRWSILMEPGSTYTSLGNINLISDIHLVVDFSSYKLMPTTSGKIGGGYRVRGGRLYANKLDHGETYANNDSNYNILKGVISPVINTSHAFTDNYFEIKDVILLPPPPSIENGLFLNTKFKVPTDICFSYVATTSNLTSKYVGYVTDGIYPYGIPNEDFTDFDSNAGYVLAKYCLFNNGLLSGVCLPEGNILITNWNSVSEIIALRIDENSAYKYINEDFLVIYKQDDKFYKLKLSSPKLKLINNQIVINADVYLNSVRISDNKKLLYAPAWNNRFLPNQNRYITEDFSLYYIASSINEYNLTDNTSILLNPIQSCLGFTKEKRYLTLNNALNINFYSSKANNSEVLYVFSWDKKDNISFLNSDLIDLPFPSNSDGNVQYSPSLFSEIKSVYGNEMFIKNGNTFYPLMKGNNNEPVMSFYLASGLDNLEEGFIVQGQFYGIINNGLYAIQYSNGTLSDVTFVVDVTGLKFCGNTPYQAFFFSKTNRCLYSFTGANIMNQSQFLDKFEDVIGYKYNPATQTIFMLTTNEVIAYSSFGTYEIFFPHCKEVYLLENGACLTDDEGNYRYIKYYAEEGYTKHNINLETCFYGMNDQTVTINDCLYVRLFSEEHESGNVEISASTLSNSGRMTEKTTFKIKSTDWDKMTHTVYLRYQPKEQRGLGVSFSINSPFKIAALSVGSQPDAILIDKVSKNAINAPQRTTNNNEW